MNEQNLNVIPGTNIPKPKIQLPILNVRPRLTLMACRKVLREAGAPEEIIQTFLSEASSKDHYHLISTCLLYIDAV